MEREGKVGEKQRTLNNKDPHNNNINAFNYFYGTVKVRSLNNVSQIFFSNNM